MLGLFGTLNLGTRSLQTQQQGVGVAGQNLANVNNPAYARQRLVMQASNPVPTGIGPAGAGADAVAIRQVRDRLLDLHIQNEASVTGFLEAQQRALQYANAAFGEQLGSAAASADGSAAVTGAGTTSGLNDDLVGLFNAFQAVSSSFGSTTSRQAAVAKAQQLVSSFHQMDQRLGGIRSQLNDSVGADVSSANDLLADIAKLNRDIVTSEAGGLATANDLRDLRQQKLESLAGLVNFQAVSNANGAVDITVGGVSMVSGGNVDDQLQAYDAGGGQMLVRSAGGGAALTLTGGSIQGAIDARDTLLKGFGDHLDALASNLITQVNTVYRNGYDLSGGTGQDFFTGSDAGDIGVNTALAADPSKFQAAGVPGAAGDNQAALALARLADAPQAALGNQSFIASYQGLMMDLGTTLAANNSQLEDQQVVQSMLQQQRTSVSGVSIDEEMADMVKFQRAFEASAKLVTTINDMLGEVIDMKR
jgi:flagellar hook-associated protein 1 FlgK